MDKVGQTAWVSVVNEHLRLPYTLFVFLLTTKLCCNNGLYIKNHNNYDEVIISSIAQCTCTRSVKTKLDKLDKTKLDK